MPKNLNSTILASAWLAGSTDFQNSVPDPSQHTVAEVVGAFSEPNAGRYFNEVTGLFNTIGQTRIQSRRWENPLEFLEGGYLRYGHSIRELAVKWVQAHCYSSDSQTLLKRRLPDFVEAFHSIDRFDRYDSTISRTEFIQSLTPEINGDGYGLDTLLGAIFDSMYSPEAYDSMRYTLQVLAEADNKWGLRRVHVPDPGTTQNGQEIMGTIEGLALRWQFPSTVYNNVDGLPVFTRPEDLVILCEPEYLAKLDTTVLASLFHTERLEDVRRRIVLVPDFPIPNVGAVLADRDFWVIRRSVFQLENFYNAEQLTTTYFLHSQGIWSASPLANIVLLGDFDTDVIPTVTVAPSTLTLEPFAATVPAGGSVQIRAKLNGAVTATPEGASTEGITVEPDSVVWEIAAPAGVALNRKTYVDRFGVLHVQKTIAANTELTVTATSTYTNPSGTTSTYTANTTITVVAPEVADNDSTEENQLAYTDIRNAVINDAAISESAADDEGGEGGGVTP